MPVASSSSRPLIPGGPQQRPTANRTPPSWWPQRAPARRSTEPDGPDRAAAVPAGATAVGHRTSWRTSVGAWDSHRHHHLGGRACPPGRMNAVVSRARPVGTDPRRAGQRRRRRRCRCRAPARSVRRPRGVPLELPPGPHRRRAMGKGAHGYVSTTLPAPELVAASESIAAVRSWCATTHPMTRGPASPSGTGAVCALGAAGREGRLTGAEEAVMRALAGSPSAFVPLLAVLAGTRRTTTTELPPCRRAARRHLFDLCDVAAPSRAAARPGNHPCGWSRSTPASGCVGIGAGSTRWVGRTGRITCPSPSTAD
jgi:hypothetical protein